MAFLTSGIVVAGKIPVIVAIPIIFELLDKLTSRSSVSPFSIAVNDNYSLERKDQNRITARRTENVKIFV